jgi:aromatic-L-amino-acid decarboxylase
VPHTDLSPLDLDAATMRRLGYRITDLVADHLATLRDRTAWRTLTRREAERLIAGPPPERPVDFDALLATLTERVIPYNVMEPHPGFMAYVPSCPTFPAALGDWIASGYNFFAGAWPVGSGVGELELTVLDWFRDWLGMPAGAGGLLTSGGSGANFTAMVAARHAAVGDEPDRLPRLTVYASDQVHSSAVRAAWMAGVPRANVRSLPSDHDFRLTTEALSAAIASDRRAGLLPMAVVASAGTTNTGAVDPLDAIADLCARERVWMHVDGAFGGFSVLTDRGRRALAGIGRADSVTLDPHKWLFVPFECGCLMTRDPKRLSAAFRILPEYLRDIQRDGEEVNFADYGEQLTRQARAIKVWINVQYYGLAALRAAIDRGIDLAVHADALIRAEPGLEVLAPTTLGVCCFRAHPAGLDDPGELDAVNARLNDAVNAEGSWHISSTRLRGRYSLRVCPIGHRTTRADVEGLIHRLGVLAREPVTLNA